MLRYRMWISIQFPTYPTVTSKMLLPTELETAMSPKPLRATITEVIKSGMDVPAARKVRPITWQRDMQSLINKSHTSEGTYALHIYMAWTIYK